MIALRSSLEDGRLELDTNTVERTIRPIALGRRNALFAGSDGGAHHWAIAASLVAGAKLNGVEPLAWLTDVLERMVDASIALFARFGGNDKIADLLSMTA